MRQLFYYKLPKSLLQNVSGFFTKCDSFTTKCVDFITNCDGYHASYDIYYKMRRYNNLKSKNQTRLISK